MKKKETIIIDYVSIYIQNACKDRLLKSSRNEPGIEIS